MGLSEYSPFVEFRKADRMVVSEPYADKIVTGGGGVSVVFLLYFICLLRLEHSSVSGLN